MEPESRAAQACGFVDPQTGAVVPPVQMSTTFERDADGSYRAGFEYTRADNPGYELPEQLLAELEGGAAAMLFASGMSAATSVFCALVPGDHVIAPQVMYWALRKWISEFALTWGVSVTYVDPGNLDELAAAVRPGRTRVVWVETPANPTWAITDLAGAARIAHGAGARLVADSTVSTPVHTRPIDFGADLVVHSATKYLNGHGDVLAGAVVVAVNDPFAQRIRAWRRSAGAVPSGFDAWLMLRGMRTLFPRVRQSSATALQIAQRFEHDPRVHVVLYPGLASHPGHVIARAQMHDGFSGMLSLRIAGGEAAAIATAARLRVFVRATSLGGTESLVEHRASSEGASTPVPADLLRFSVGLEHPDDLIADLDQALDHGISGNPAPLPPTDAFSALRRTVIARGGDLTKVDGRIVASGSPGAVEPLREDLDLAPVTATTARGVIDEVLNPMVAAHDGQIELVSDTGGIIRVRLTGGCQGCALAQMTVRQGIEVVLRRHVAGVVAVIDETDHGAGDRPHFPATKR
ncbi:MAG TPA: PLP-dependent transferase [Acidimicrobiia bacterium]|jgi:cystathionine gamma-synthase|nr:PLP-dependent transferase [Acidimicrobiia bacterium]